MLRFRLILFSRSVLLGLLMVVCGTQLRTQGAESDSLEQAFRTPPNSARPWVHWMWMDGNITREGITADLESMQRVGIHGAVLMDITAEIPPGRVTFLSEEWKALFQHAVQEAARLGLELSVNTLRQARRNPKPGSR